MSELKDRIKKRRQELGLTLLQVADYVGVKEATAQRYESGDIKNIKHETIVILSEILKCSPQYLMGWDDELIPIEDSNKLLDHDRRLIEKYRSLDVKGRHTINTVLDMEYKRCLNERKEEPFVIAAHNDDYSDEQIRLMREDLEEL